MTAARGGQKYLNKIFNCFNLSVDWSDMKDIRKVFEKILSLDKGKLYQEYFKRMQVMNKQHFPYIVRM